MSILDLITKLVSKNMKPKVYSVNIWVGTQSFLNLVVAYSLEEAFALTKAEFKKFYPAIDMKVVELKQFCCAEPDALFQKHFDQEQGKVEAPLNAQVVSALPTKVGESVAEVAKPVVAEKPVDKNVLMKQILDSGDLKSLEEKKSQFSEAEFQYLVAEINKKGNSKK